MSLSTNRAYSHCDTQNRFVSLHQTEGQCRDRHNCSDGACPLEKQFDQNRFGRALAMLAASIPSGVIGSGQR